VEQEYDYSPLDNFVAPQDLIPIDYDLLKAMTPPVWAKRGLCHSETSEYVNVFYPDTDTHGGNPLAIARKMCLQCPVRYDCLEYGLDEQWGVWGGHSASQRRKLSSMMKKGSTLLEASQQIDARSRDVRK
jgi:WhiB family redox-sensing transcriptional regulator